MSALPLLLRTRPRNPATDSLKLGTLRSPRSSLLDGLQVFYPMQEASGVRQDVIGRGVGPAAKFTRANNERLIVTDNAEMSIGNVNATFAVWVRLDALTDAQTCFGKNLTTGNQRAYRCTYRSVPDQWQFVVSAAGTGTDGTVTADAPGLSAWRLLIVEHDADADELRMRLDDGEPTTVSYSGGIFDNTASFAIGADTNASANSLDGAVRSFGLWKRILTAAELDLLWNYGRGVRYAQLPESLHEDLAEWFDLDEPSGNRTGAHAGVVLTDTNTVTHTTGITGNSLADVNTVTQTDGKTGKCAVFTAANSEQLVAPDATALRGGDSDWELSGWLYLETTAADMSILTKDSEGAGGREYALGYDNSSDVLRWEVFDGTDVIGTVDAAELGAPADDTWYFVRVWHDAANNEVGIQVNGGTADTAATTGAPSSGTTQPVRFGANGSGSPDYLNGRLDEWGKWSRITTAGEVTTRYNGGDGRAFPFSTAGV